MLRDSLHYSIARFTPLVSLTSVKIEKTKCVNFNSVHFSFFFLFVTHNLWTCMQAMTGELQPRKGLPVHKLFSSRYLFVFWVRNPVVVRTRINSSSFSHSLASKTVPWLLSSFDEKVNDARPFLQQIEPCTSTCPQSVKPLVLHTY